MKFWRTAVMSALVLANMTGVVAVGSPPLRTIAIENGITPIEFAAGVKGMAVSAMRQNFDAHDFEVVALYIKTDVGLNIVSRFDKSGREELELAISGGADCILHDFRLLPAGGERPMTLIVADRELGESFMDAEAVRFSFYELKHNTEGEVGRPLWYFESSRIQNAKKTYCDVDEAFRKELGLGDPDENSDHR